MVRTVTWPLSTTGFSMARLTPMIPTSGILMTGVETMPPSLPRLVIVMVEPLSSDFVMLLLRAASATRRISAASCCTDKLCAFFTTGTF